MRFIRRYLPDALLLAGVFILSVSTFRQSCNLGSFLPTCSEPKWPEIIGAMLVVFAIDVMVRRFFARAMANQLSTGIFKDKNVYFAVAIIIGCIVIALSFYLAQVDKRASIE